MEANTLRKAFFKTVVDGLIDGDLIVSGDNTEEGPVVKMFSILPSPITGDKNNEEKFEAVKEHDWTISINGDFFYTRTDGYSIPFERLERTRSFINGYRSMEKNIKKHLPMKECKRGYTMTALVFLNSLSEMIGQKSYNPMKSFEDVKIQIL